jgi:glycosyltransferase involved in cell wall biosynthesis
VTTLHVVVPVGIDDPARPSGGNVYDRRICDGLADLGWSVREHPVQDAVAFAAVLSRLPDRALVLVDGLIGSAAPEAMLPSADRLRLIMLVHAPLDDRTREAAALSAAIAIVTTSEWTRRELRLRYALPDTPIHVAYPGTDPADPAPGTPDGDQLLCVGAVTPVKGQDVLAEALRLIPGRRCRCRCVGSLDRDPAYVAGLPADDRLVLAGTRTGVGLASLYATSDLLVLPSRSETYGMVVAEALARGLPVIASDVGGVREALGSAGDGVPGLLVPPDDPPALASTLARWLDEPDLRADLRAAAAIRRPTLSPWHATAARLKLILELFERHAVDVTTNSRINLKGGG